MIQHLLASSPPLAGRLLLSALMLELPLSPLLPLLLLLLLLLVHNLPELQHARPTCHYAEKNISFTSKIHVTSSHREPQAFTITVKSLSFEGDYLQLFLICVCVFQGLRIHMTANVRARITSFSKYSNIYRDCPGGIYCRCRDM